ncbi:hypothetical protein Tco_0177883 [Tanacetum coccineum]
MLRIQGKKEEIKNRKARQPKALLRRQVNSCSKECKESYAKLKKLYDEQRAQLSDASIEIQAYTQALKKVEAQLVAHQQGQLSLSHLIRDCDFHEKRMAKQVELNKQKGKGNVQRENKPVWNNVQRMNHQNQFVPTAVLTRTGKIQVSTTRASEGDCFNPSMIVERRYPLSNELLQRMLDLGLEVERESIVALDLITFIKQQIDEE